MNLHSDITKQKGGRLFLCITVFILINYNKPMLFIFLIKGYFDKMQNHNLFVCNTPTENWNHRNIYSPECLILHTSCRELQILMTLAVTLRAKMR